MAQQSEDEFEELILFVNENDHQEFKRLDQLLGHKISDFSRTYLKKIFQSGLIQGWTGQDIETQTGNETEQEIKLELKKLPPIGTKITLRLPHQKEAELEAQNIPLEILYEDEDLVIINKPAGMVTHPAPGHPDGTLVNAILHHCPNLKGMHDSKRPGIVHRLDKGTSGVMVVAKAQKAHEGLVKLFSSHNIDRVYQALTIGPEVPVGGTIKSTLGRHPQNRLKMAADVRDGKEAITHYRCLDKNLELKLHHFELKLETGRTHQIRVHLSQLLRHPILCDPIYANPRTQLQQINGPEIIELLKDYPHQLLHARVLGFKHPLSGKKIFIEKEAPEIFQKVLNTAFKKN